MQRRRQFQDAVRSDRIAFLDEFTTNFFAAGDRTDLISEPSWLYHREIVAFASPKGTLDCVAVCYTARGVARPVGPARRAAPRPTFADAHRARLASGAPCSGGPAVQIYARWVKSGERRIRLDIKAEVAFGAGEPLMVETAQLEGPKAGEVLVEIELSGA